VDTLNEEQPMRLGTAIMLTTFASLGAGLWRVYARSRPVAVKAPQASDFDGWVLPPLFSTRIQVAYC
jgi:hypothetical protein